MGAYSGRLLAHFDVNGDGRLDAIERANPRERLEDLPPMLASGHLRLADGWLASLFAGFMMRTE